MTDKKPTLLRLRADTVAMLKAEASKSAYGSMASVADEILRDELTRRLDRRGVDLDRLIAAAGKVS